MPVFLAGLAAVAKAGCTAGIVFGVGDFVWQTGTLAVSDEPPPVRRRHGRVYLPPRDKKNRETYVGRVLEAMHLVDSRRTLHAFGVGTVVGTCAGALWTGAYGISTMAHPLTREGGAAVVALALLGTMAWAPVYIMNSQPDDSIEQYLPNYFLKTLLYGTSLYLATTVAQLWHIRTIAICVCAEHSAMLLVLFVNKYSFLQSQKRVLYPGVLTEATHKWLIVAGALSGNLVAAALIAVPFYHPGHFLVWGITNPALMYTMCLVAEQEIENEQMEHYRKTINVDALQQRRLARALLPLLGLPFGYVADREDVSHMVKVLLAGVGAVSLGVNIAMFDDEWVAFYIDDTKRGIQEAPLSPAVAPNPYPVADTDDTQGWEEKEGAEGKKGEGLAPL